MKTVFDAIQAVDQDLYVRKIARWKEERQQRGGGARRNNVVYLRPKERPRCDFPQGEQGEADDFLEPLTAGQRVVLVLVAAAAVFTACTFLFP